jgi:hypothetical protein
MGAEYDPLNPYNVRANCADWSSMLDRATRGEHPLQIKYIYQCSFCTASIENEQLPGHGFHVLGPPHVPLDPTGKWNWVCGLLVCPKHTIIVDEEVMQRRPTFVVPGGVKE